MTVLDRISSWLPIDTKIVSFITESKPDEEQDEEDLVFGNITDIEIADISSLALPNIVACNVIINCFLACFGIDVASIARSKVLPVDYRLVDIQNLLIKSKWEDTNVTMNGTTKKAYEWIQSEFNIYSKENFVNQLYRKLTDVCLNSQDGKEIVISVNDEIYQMIKLIAYCYKADRGFSSIPLGNSETIHVEFDGWHFYEMLDKIGEALEAEGYIADKTQVVHNQTLGQWFGNSIDWTDSDNPVFTSSVQCTLIIHKYTNAQIGYGGEAIWNGYTGTFPYGQGEDVWFYEILISDSSYGNVRRIEYGEARQNDAVNAGNIYGQTGNNSWYYPIVYANLVIYDDNDNIINLPSGANVPWWDIKCGRYYTMGYTGSILAQTTQRWTSSIRPYLADSELNFYRTPNNEYLLGTPYPIYSDAINTLAPYEYSTPMIGNEGDIVHEETVPEPTTDDTILGDIDDIDMLKTGFFRRITLGIEGMLEALKTRLNFYDTTVNLKTEIIKGGSVSIRTGMPVFPIEQDASGKYTANGDISLVPYKNNASAFNRFITEQVYYLSDLYNINKFIDFMWNKNFWDNVIMSLNNFNPTECISDVITYPFEISPLDYSEEKKAISAGGYAMTLPQVGSVEGHKVINYVKVITSDAVPIGITETHKNAKIERTEIDDTFLNYEPYSQAKIYIPFVGERDIDISMILYRYVKLEYRIYIPTGDFIVTLRAFRYEDSANLATSFSNDYGLSEIGGDAKTGYPVLTAKGNMGRHHRLVARGQMDAIGTLKSAISTIGGAMSGGTGGAMVGAVIGSSSQSLNGINHVCVSGTSYSDIEGLLANWMPYITLYKHEPIRGYSTDTNTAFMQTIGKRSERGITIKNMGKGFHKVKGAKLDGIKCTMEEQRMIEQILAEGFYKASDPKPEKDKT